MKNHQQTITIERKDFPALLDILQKHSYETVGPTIRDGAIIYDVLSSTEDLPKGWTEDQDAGKYRLKKRQDKALFGFNNGPHSWKKYLFPPKEKLFQVDKTKDGFVIDAKTAPAKAYAFIGVRACDLAAIEMQDKIFAKDKAYMGRRNKAFIVAVNCGQAAKTCFCTSMNTGPKCNKGFDLALTEILDEDRHYFVAEAGSEKGQNILTGLPGHPAKPRDQKAVIDTVKRAVAQMGRKIDITDIQALLTRNYDNARWDELAKRCLACGNCTMVCPTCFCSKVEDVTDLTGDHAERWRSWDSCFTLDFSYINGGHMRPSIRARYRQWLTHKLATWLDQFGASGCTGCGRCVTWCPVGIDLTEEVKAIRDSEKESSHGRD